MVRRLAYSAVGHLPVRLKLLLNRLVSDSFLVGLVGVVYDPDGRVLVLRHTYRPAMPHGLPSGWLRRGESVSEGLQREIREETGFEVAFERILQIDTGQRPPRLDIWLLFSFAGGDFRPSAEVSDAAFYRIQDLPRIPSVQVRFLRNLYVGSK